MNIVKYDYNGNSISFDRSDGVMVNATQMAKPFNKKAKDWLKTQQCKEFLESLSVGRKILTADLVIVRQGGTNQGTWMHEDVALEFARWLSPQFAIWTNIKIKELLTEGVATVSNDDETIAKAMDILYSRLEQAKREKALLENKVETQKVLIETQETELKTQAPKVEYYDQVLQSQSTMTTTQVANMLGTTAEKLNKNLKACGFLYYQSGQWLLRSPYSGMGLHKVRTQHYTRYDGTVGTNSYTVYNENGKRFITILHNNNYNLSKAVKEYGCNSNHNTSLPEN